MSYNVRLKKYKNGTFQLTYYHRAIRTKEDYWRPYNYPDLHTTDYDEDEEEFDIDKWIELKQSSPFDMSYDPLQVTEIRKDKNGEVMLNKKGEPVPNKYFGEYLRTSYPDGEYIYNIKEYRNGYTTATKITDTYKAVSYIVKYITKDLCECTFGKQRYLVTKNLDLPDSNRVSVFEFNV